MFEVIVYDVYNNVHKFDVESREKGREYAKRILDEGLWFIDGAKEVFYPVHRIIKVVIVPMNAVPIAGTTR